jgi:cyclic pyranopterin phosphate synthase
MPEKPFSWVPKENILSFEELFLFVKTSIDSGINKIRITGGEPTLREDLDAFLKMIHDYAPEVDLALTTNGFLMGRYAQRYADAGLKRINMSLDSLKEEVVNRIAKRDVYKDVIAGIEATKKAGLKIKLNSVPMQGINDMEILDLLEYSKKENITIRYIEYMENNYADQSIKGLKSSEILNIIRTRYEITKVKKDESSPAQYYALPCGYEFGVIEPHQDDFCKSCNRIRLTAEGFLIPCLYFDEALSIKEFVKKGDVKGAAKVLETLLATKPEKNRWIGESDDISTRAFYETGG